jgi:prophage regulatory protein
MSTVQLRASTRSFGVELSPACARDLAAALLAQAEAIKPIAPPPPKLADPVRGEAQPKALPATGFIRQSELIPHIIPFSSTTLWRKVKAGEFRSPVKLSQRVTAWRAEDVRAWMSVEDRLQ